MRRCSTRPVQWMGVVFAKVSLYGGCHAQNAFPLLWRRFPAARTQVAIQSSFRASFRGGAVMNLPIQLIDFAVANAASRTTREELPP